MPGTETIDILASMPLFQGLSGTQFAEIASATHAIRIQKCEKIFLEGERPKGLFQVLDGQIKLAVSSDEGDEKVIEIYSSGESFGLSELFGRQPCCCFAQAVQPTELLVIGKQAIVALVEKDPRIATRLLSDLADRTSHLQRDIATYCFHSANRRTLDFLRQQAAQECSRKGVRTVELRIRKQLIAARLGLTPESLSRALRELADAGLIAVQGRQVSLREALFSDTVAPARPVGRAAGVREVAHGQGLAAEAGAWA